MYDKSTVYIEDELKEAVQIELIKQGKKNYLSKLINELLKNWLRKQRSL